MTTPPRRSPQIRIEETLHFRDSYMSLEFFLVHDVDQMLEGSIVSTFWLTKGLNEVSLVPPTIEELSTPIRVPEKEHAYTTRKMSQTRNKMPTSDYNSSFSTSTKRTKRRGELDYKQLKLLKKNQINKIVILWRKQRRTENAHLQIPALTPVTSSVTMKSGMSSGLTSPTTEKMISSWIRHKKSTDQQRFQIQNKVQKIHHHIAVIQKIYGQLLLTSLIFGFVTAESCTIKQRVHSVC